MKTIFTPRLLAILILTTAALTSTARDDEPEPELEQIEIDGIYYEVHDDKLEVIKHPQGYSGVVIIPETVMHGNKPYTVTTVSITAFRFCKDLLTIGIPATVNDIDAFSNFVGCESLEEIYVDPNNETYASYDRAMYDKAMTTILWCPQRVEGKYEIAEGTITTGPSSFRDCTLLTGVTLPESMASLGSYTFRDCCGITAITLPDNMTSIGDHAFYRCTALTDINIPDRLVSIGSGAFSNCCIKEINIPNSVTDIKDNAFFGCKMLEHVTLPDNMTSIPDYMFQACKSLMDIKIPENVTSIGYSSFGMCQSITKIVLPDGVNSIDGAAFSGCVNLESINLPNGITDIKRYCFSGCKSLKEITISANVTTIGYGAFSGCEALADVTNLSTVPQTIDEETFSNFGILHVPAGSEQLYAQAEGWRMFNIVGDATVPDAIDNIEADKENATARYYGIDGRMRQTETHQGITIVKTMDGKTRKVAGGGRR